MIDETHDPTLRSWVESANHPHTDFPIQNLPLGVYRAIDEQRPRLGVAIGDSILDLQPWLSGETLNDYMRLSAIQRRDLRRELSKVLASKADKRPLLAQSQCKMMLPANIGGYSDFYASIHHATNVGRIFRPDNPLLPNYKHVPIAYHGRTSSIIISGTPIHRPAGQLGLGEWGPTAELDYEIELGVFLGPGNKFGEPIPIENTEHHLVGVCLLNDWSARDIQRWEAQPLGPFLAKNFATSISPWVVTRDALEPFRLPCPAHEQPELRYLRSDLTSAFNISLEVHLRSSRMQEPVRISSSNFKEMYWTLGQMVAHHASNGCPIRAGDLIGSGTVSGPAKNNRGCLLELTSNGAEPVPLPNGEERFYLQDGDEVVFKGHCHREGFVTVGLGSCVGTVQPFAYNQMSDS